MKAIRMYFTGSCRMAYLILMLVFLVSVDGLISQFLVKHGLGREGNPFLQTFVNEENFLLIKLAGALLCAFILWDIYKRRPRLALISTLIFVILYTGIVFWNLGIFVITQV